MMVHLSPVLQNNTSRFVSKIVFSEDARQVSIFFHLHSFRYTPNNALSLHIFLKEKYQLRPCFSKISAPLSQAIGKVGCAQFGEGFRERKSATFECSFITPPISVESAEKT